MSQIFSPSNSPQPSRDNNNVKIIVIGVVAVVAIIGAVACFFFYVNSTKNEPVQLEQTSTEEVVAQEVATPVDRQQQEPASVDDHPISTEPVYTPSAASSVDVLNDGRNVFAGTFNYKGAKYGFSITFRYDPITGIASDATYEADGYGGVSKLRAVEVSDDQTSIILSGKASGTDTYISVTAAPGSRRYSGSMTRGTHDGTCTMTLQ